MAAGPSVTGDEPSNGVNTATNMSQDGYQPIGTIRSNEASKHMLSPSAQRFKSTHCCAQRHSVVWPFKFFRWTGTQLEKVDQGRSTGSGVRLHIRTPFLQGPHWRKNVQGCRGT